MTNSGNLLLPIGPGLTFRFENAPDFFLLRARAFLRKILDGELEFEVTPGSLIRISLSSSRIQIPSGSTLVLQDPPILVWLAGDNLFFEAPSIQASCDATGSLARISLNDPSEEELELFLGLVLAPLLIELALGRDWLGIHAASVAVNGYGILLPGPSGAGKSTIFKSMATANYGVLSDDLTWINLQRQHLPRMHAFPYGLSAPTKTVDNAGVNAIICPVITAKPYNQLIPIGPTKILQILVEESSFLSSGEATKRRFQALVQLCQDIPGFSLEAGSDRKEVPLILEELIANLNKEQI